MTPFLLCVFAVRAYAFYHADFQRHVLRFQQRNRQRLHFFACRSFAHAERTPQPLTRDQSLVAGLRIPIANLGVKYKLYTSSPLPDFTE
jgi:hypothetical protein